MHAKMQIIRDFHVHAIACKAPMHAGTQAGAGRYKCAQIFLLPQTGAIYASGWAIHSSCAPSKLARLKWYPAHVIWVALRLRVPPD